MKGSESYHIQQLRDYSSLFTRSEVKSWLINDFSSIDYKIERYDFRWKNKLDATYLDYLKYAYKSIKHHYANEYVFKNEFLSSWLLRELGQSGSKIFNEFRVGNAIADLAMFNGKSRVFEIKTELDSDYRLDQQLKNYEKAFNLVYLIVPKEKVLPYSQINKDLGIIGFDSTDKDRFFLHSKPTYNPIVDSHTIIDILHTNEYKNIVLTYYGSLPEMNSFNQFSICSELIQSIPNEDLNTLFINQLKKRGKNPSLSSHFHREFNQISLSLKLSYKDRDDLITRLKRPLNT